MSAYHTYPTAPSLPCTTRTEAEAIIQLNIDAENNDIKVAIESQLSDARLKLDTFNMIEYIDKANIATLNYTVNLFIIIALLGIIVGIFYYDNAASTILILIVCALTVILVVLCASAAMIDSKLCKLKEFISDHRITSI